jgi:AcrR family transcriptional regulator
MVAPAGTERADSGACTGEVPEEEDSLCIFVNLIYIFQMIHGVVDLDAARHSPHVAQKRRTRIRRILRAALEVVRVEGRDALTLKRVAQEQGLTTAALYRYFPSKDALVADLQRAVIASLAEVTRERVESADRFAIAEGFQIRERAVLAIVLSGFVFEAFSREAPMEFGILSDDLSKLDYTLPDREAGLVFDAAWAALSDLASRLLVAEQSGALVEGVSSERAMALWAGLQGVVQTRKLTRSAPDRIDSTRVARGLVEALLLGWGADARQMERILRWIRENELYSITGSTLDFFDRPIRGQNDPND